MGTVNSSNIDSSNTVEDETSFRDFKGFPSALPSYAEDDKSPPLSLRELDCMLLSNLIREKPEWQRKIHDQTIVDKWIQECRDQSSELPSGTAPTDAMVQYVLDEVCFHSPAHFTFSQYSAFCLLVYLHTYMHMYCTIMVFVFFFLSKSSIGA